MPEPSARPSSDDGSVSITAAGRRLTVPAGMSVAAALLMHDIRVLRRSVQDRTPRGLFCGMGVCYECLVTVDGLSDQRACRVRVHDGMRIDLPEP